MATLGWLPDRSLSEALQARFAQFNLLQMIRLWLRRPGGQPAALHKSVRFCADLDAAFPGRAASAVSLSAPTAGALADAAVAGTAPALKIMTPDFCVGSTLGPLPQPFLEWMRDLARSGRPAMRDFLDLFNNRINQLRYRMRAEFELGLNNQRPEQTQLAGSLACLLGVGSLDEVAQIPLSPRVWLAMGDLLANSRRCAAGATQVLAALLYCPVRLEPLVGAWRAIEPADRHALGLGERRLGADTLLGHGAWDQLARVRIVIGPMGYADMLPLLPRLAHTDSPPLSARAARKAWQILGEGGAGTFKPMAFEQLQGLVRLLLDRRHDVELQLQVRAAELPRAWLTARALSQRDGAAYAGLRLGRTAWLISHKDGVPNTVPLAGPVPPDPSLVPPREQARVRDVNLLIPAYDEESEP
jgi:type VI secretion system protein ImpH